MGLEPSKVVREPRSVASGRYDHVVAVAQVAAWGAEITLVIDAASEVIARYEGQTTRDAVPPDEASRALDALVDAVRRAPFLPSGRGHLDGTALDVQVRISGGAVWRGTAGVEWPDRTSAMLDVAQVVWDLAHDHALVPPTTWRD